VDAVKAARKDATPMKMAAEVKQAAEDLHKSLDEQVDQFTPTQYIEGKRFLNQLKRATDALQGPDLKQLLELQEKLAACNTVAELVAFLAKEDLLFGPALPEQSTAYEDFYRILKGEPPAQKK
jgi:hypothetical protein